MEDKQFKKYPTNSMTFLPGRLTKDPEIKTLEARTAPNGDTLPEKKLLKLTVVDSAGSDYFQDVFTEASFDVSRSPKHVLKKLRKGDWVELRGKVEYRVYEGKDGPRIAGEMRYPKDFVLAPGDWLDRPLIDDDQTKGVDEGGKQEKLPW